MLRGLIRQVIRLSAQQARLNKNIEQTKLRIARIEQQQKKRQENINVLCRQRAELLSHQSKCSTFDENRPEEWQSY